MAQTQRVAFWFTTCMFLILYFQMSDFAKKMASVSIQARFVPREVAGKLLKKSFI